jgi:serine protease Do
MSLDRRPFRFRFLTALLLAGFLSGAVPGSHPVWLPLVQAAPQEAKPAATGGVTLPNFVPVVKTATPAVVNISTTRVVRSQGGEMPREFMDDPFLRRFFGEEFFHRFQIPRDRREASLGSGVIVSADGYIVTNNHVIAKADEIKVVLHDKREFTGKVVGTDPKTDLAVIKIGAKRLPTVPWGDSDRLEVGEYVLAIGNPFALNQTVTMGIVSAVGRANVGIADYEDFIQTDAAINPGNSGGALVNTRGELVGVNTAIFSRSGGYMGIGFAVPSNMVRAVMSSLIKEGKVIRGWLGVSIQQVTPDLAKQFGIKDNRGALVSEVIPDSPAASAGIQGGDVITRFNGKAVDGPVVLRNAVAGAPIGKKVPLELVRDKKTLTLEARIVEQPKEIAQAEGETVRGEDRNPAFAGVEVRNLTPDIARQLGLPPATTGVVVVSVAPGSAADQAGIEEGDLIIEINRQPVRHTTDFKRLSAKLGKKETALLLTVRRGGKLFVPIKP